MVPRVKMISLVSAALMKRGDLCARFFVGVGRLLAQLVDAAMDVGVFGFVVADEAIDHRPGLLRGGAVVEVDQRLAVRVG